MSTRSCLATSIGLVIAIMLFSEANAMYAPSIGRFISRDPIAYKGSPGNLYQFVRSNPIVFSDPTGKDRYRCGGSHPGDHSQLYIDDPNGGYVIFEIGFPGAIGSSSSANCGACGVSWNGFGFVCSYLGPGYSSVPLNETHSDTRPGNCRRYPSSPQEDQALIDRLRTGPQTFGFHPWFNNCHCWTLRQLNGGYFY